MRHETMLAGKVLAHLFHEVARVMRDLTAAFAYEVEMFIRVRELPPSGSPLPQP